MSKLKITILSGGSGNDRLIRGLRSLYSNCDIKVITNAYDNGKSTGVCRAITDTLGVSDIRKNHSRMYETLEGPKDSRLLEFYNNRYNFTKDNEEAEVVNLLRSWGLNKFIHYAKNFFNRESASEYEFKDFSVANIIYAEMYSELGYEETNRIFCDLLGLDDFVLLNSFDNVYLKAMTESGYIIGDEGELVVYDNAKDKIVNTFYTGSGIETLNQKAIDRVIDCDLLVISTGTFWSSIYPTIQYGNFYKYINNSSAKKIWVIDNVEDHDAWGVSSNDFIKIMERVGLDLSKFTILENLDAIKTLRQDNDNYNIVKIAMGNTNGKHDPDKYAKALLKIFYGIEHYSNYDNILFDFDDTLWGRDNDLKVSTENVNIVNSILKDKAVIISGNSYSSIENKIKYIYGSNLSDFNIDIWADANSRLFRNGKEIYCLENLTMKDPELTISQLKDYDLPASSESAACIKVKPLESRERKILADLLNMILEDSAEARITGRTTIDIVNKNNSKVEIFKYLNLENKNTLYIGDEIDHGNDRDISDMCTHSIHTSGAEETNVLLKLLCED